ncbi:MAG: hypothetical protein QOG63_1132 [Thermoleophilaceae bacterium]|nr:hypothetical protein [Thermoleophilaceae bacterium]
MPADAVFSIGAAVSSMPASVAPLGREPDVAVDRLADCVRRLDPGTRALLDLSVRRRLRDDAMAPLLRTDPFHLAWRRARALERVASDLGGDEPVPLASVRAALETLPREVWDPLSVPALPRKASEPASEPAEPELIIDAEVVEEVTGELVPAPSVALALPLGDRLDAFAQTAPTLRQAFADVGRAVARKAVRLVVWRRRA